MKKARLYKRHAFFSKRLLGSFSLLPLRYRFFQDDVRIATVILNTLLT